MMPYLVAIVGWHDPGGGPPRSSLIVHRGTCPVGAQHLEALVLKKFRWAKEAIRWVTDAVGAENGRWRRCPICVPSERRGLSSAPLRRTLKEVLASEPRARAPLVDEVAAFGGAAIEAIEPWLYLRKLAGFAVYAIQAASEHDPDLARATLERAQWTTTPIVAARIRSALERLGASVDLWPRLPADARSVAFVGDGPHLAADLARIVPIGELVRDPEAEGFVDTIVLGLDAVPSSHVYERMNQSPRPARYLPQEGWIELVLFGRDWWQDSQRLNDAASDHAPLGEVKRRWPRADFGWPGTSVSGDGPPMEQDFHEVGFLRISGYQLTGMDHGERMNVLRRVTIPLHGLQKVAEEIANFVRLAKLRVKSDWSYAIGQWELDLEVLWREEYPKHHSRFPWPETGPDSPRGDSGARATTKTCVCGAVFKSARDVVEVNRNPLGLCGVKGRTTHRGPG
jgi:hypothetical protein